MNILPNIIAALFLLAAGDQPLTEATNSSGFMDYPGEGEVLKKISILSPAGNFRYGRLSSDEKLLLLQGSLANESIGEQIWMVPLQEEAPHMISMALGRTAYPIFTPLKRRIIYCSTDIYDPAIYGSIPLIPNQLWTLDEFDIISIDTNGLNRIELTNKPGYDSEVSISPDGKKIVFTSTRDGDIDIYKMEIWGSQIVRLTDTFGAECQPCFSPDGKWIIFTSHTPETPEEKQLYKDMLSSRVIMNTRFELQIMRSDGSERKAITDLGSVSLNPAVHPVYKQVVFSSNYNPDAPLSDNNNENFELFIINIDGMMLNRVTDNTKFDGYPSFSKSGEKLIWSSGRDANVFGETAVFSGIWKGSGQAEDMAGKWEPLDVQSSDVEGFEIPPLPLAPPLEGEEPVQPKIKKPRVKKRK